MNEGPFVVLLLQVTGLGRLAESTDLKRYELATRRTFRTAEGAQQFAASINPSRAPLVVDVYGLRFRTFLEVSATEAMATDE